MNVRMLRKYFVAPIRSPRDDERLAEAREGYELVVDPGTGEPVSVVTAIEWDDEHKALVLRLG